jgi:hypothetical protein
MFFVVACDDVTWSVFSEFRNVGVLVVGFFPMSGLMFGPHSTCVFDEKQNGFVCTLEERERRFLGKTRFAVEPLLGTNRYYTPSNGRRGSGVYFVAQNLFPRFAGVDASEYRFTVRGACWVSRCLEFMRVCVCPIYVWTCRNANEPPPPPPPPPLFGVMRVCVRFVWGV